MLLCLSYPFLWPAATWTFSQVQLWLLGWPTFSCWTVVLMTTPLELKCWRLSSFWPRAHGLGLLSSVANALGSMSPSCWHMLEKMAQSKLMVDKTLWSNLASTHEHWARQLCKLGSRRGPGSHPSSKFRAPGPWQRLRIHGVTHGVMLGQQRGREHMNIAAKQSRTHGMTHGVSKAPVLMIHGLTCQVGE